jgi:hypothetical protein
MRLFDLGELPGADLSATALGRRRRRLVRFRDADIEAFERRRFVSKTGS